MPTFYLDSSALLKKYKTEKGTDAIRELFAGRLDNEVFVTSYLTLIEGYGLFRRLRNNSEISQTLFETWLGDLVTDLRDRIVTFKITDHIASDAAEQARNHGLSSADSFQLATALRARVQGDPFIYFLATDRRLKNVSRDIGFEVLDPEEQDALPTLKVMRAAAT